MNRRSFSRYELAKRVVDIGLALAAIAVTAPMMIVVALIIRIDSPGSSLYRGLRTGLRGKPFYILKFRTMCVDAEQRGGSCTSDDDSRITRVGAFLRKSKLDELPQLFNVLFGTMSLVGPRPEVQKFTDLFTREERSILEVKPGITDWATIWDSDEGALLLGAADPERAYMERIRPMKLRLQLEYVRKRSFWVDLTILFQTVSLVAHRALRRQVTSTAQPHPLATHKETGD